MAIDKTKIQEITLERQRAFAYRNKNGYELEFDKDGNWIVPMNSNDVAVSVPAHLGLTPQQQKGFALSVNKQLYEYHKRLTGQEKEAISLMVEFSLKDGNKIIIKLHTKTDPELYSEFEMAVSDLTNEQGDAKRADVMLQGTWDVGHEIGFIDGDTEMDDYGAFLTGPRYISGSWDDEGYHYYNESKNRLFWPFIHDAKVLQRQVDITLQQQRLFVERGKAAVSFEFDKDGFWISEISYKSPSEAFAALLGDYDRASITYGNETIPRSPEFKKAIEEETRLLAESNRLSGERAKYNRDRKKLAEIEEEEKKLQVELAEVSKKMEAAQPKPSQLSREERIKSLLQDELRLTEKQAIGFAYSIGQQLYGYHKRLIGLGQEPGDDQDIPYTVKFSRVDEKIVAELHTETDPKLYSRFEIAVSELTNEAGQPQQARVRLDSTISSNSYDGEWQEDGYHYRSAAKARLFWSSIEEKQAADEKKPTTTEQLSSADKSTLFEMVGPMLILAKAFTLVKEVVSSFVTYMESQPSTHDVSVPTPVAPSSVVEKSTADSQNRYGLFAIIGAAGKMLMSALTIEVASRNLAPPPSEEIESATFGKTIR